MKIANWAIQDPVTKKYNIGASLLQLAISLTSKIDLRSAAQPYLRMLYHKVDEGVMLTVRIGLERMYVEQIESRHEVRQVADIGTRLPCGQELLAKLYWHIWKNMILKQY